jgi:hypothetical protein
VDNWFTASSEVAGKMLARVAVTDEGSTWRPAITSKLPHIILGHFTSSPCHHPLYRDASGHRAGFPQGE